MVVRPVGGRGFGWGLGGGGGVGLGAGVRVGARARARVGVRVKARLGGSKQLSAPAARGRPRRSTLVHLHSSVVALVRAPSVRVVHLVNLVGDLMRSQSGDLMRRVWWRALRSDALARAGRWRRPPGGRRHAPQRRRRPQLASARRLWPRLLRPLSEGPRPNVLQARRTRRQVLRLRPADSVRPLLGQPGRV